MGKASARLSTKAPPQEARAETPVGLTRSVALRAPAPPSRGSMWRAAHGDDAALGAAPGTGAGDDAAAAAGDQAFAAVQRRAAGIHRGRARAQSAARTGGEPGRGCQAE